MEKCNVYLTKECPLIVNDDSTQVDYGVVVLEPGAYIELRGGSVFSIDTLVRKMPEELDVSPYSWIPKITTERDKAVQWQHDIVVTGSIMILIIKNLQTDISVLNLGTLFNMDENQGNNGNRCTLQIKWGSTNGSTLFYQDESK